MFTKNLYDTVTARILSQLKERAAPWIKPWSSTPSANQPCNAISNRPYSGCNIVLLWIEAQSQNWTNPRYLTFKQAKECGGHVRQGEHGVKIYFVKQLIVKDKNAESNDATKVIPMLKEYTVFNVAQCADLPEKIVNPVKLPIRNTEERDQIADSFVASTKADIREGGEAYFIPSKDYVSMPAFAAFKNADSFYATLFHELGHWTGAKPRLDRDLKNRFGNSAYAAEELIAELTSAFLCAEFSVDGDIRHAGYIQNWIQLLQNDNRAFFTAASKAQAAADYLRGLALKEDSQDDIAA
jgi:antirestriction protein ArdC